MQTSPVVRLGIVDRSTLLTESLVIALNSEPDFEVCWATDDLQAAYRHMEDCLPDLVLVDFELGHGALQFVRKLAHTPARPIILTTNASNACVREALRINVAGYLLKDEPLQDVLHSLRQIRGGERAFAREVRERLRFDPAENRYELPACHFDLLTTRQIEIVMHLANGDSAKQIANALHLSVKGVNSHIYRIMRKLNIHDRVQLTRFAIREGLVTP